MAASESINVQTSSGTEARMGLVDALFHEEKKR